MAFPVSYWKYIRFGVQNLFHKGELAKQVMIKERYYALEGEVLNVDKCLGNEMADVIAQIMRLADYYEIDLEKAFIEAREDEDRYLKSRGV